MELPKLVQTAESAEEAIELILITRVFEGPSHHLADSGFVIHDQYPPFVH
jgi:hypothetical protein